MNNKQIKIGAILSYLIYIIKMIIQLLFVPITLSFIGQNEYGVYQLVASLVSYLGLLNFGFGGAYFRFYSQCKSDKEKEAQVNATFLLLFVFFSILVAVSGFVVINNIQQIIGDKLTFTEVVLAKDLLVILVINLIISFPLSIFSSIISSREKFIYQKLLDLIQSILNPGLTFILLIKGYGSYGIVIVTLLITLCVGSINIYYVIFKIKAPFNFKLFDLSLVKDIGCFSIFLFLNTIIDQINWNTDKYLLGRFVGTAAISIYSIGSQINAVYIQLTDMIATVLAPRINYIVANEVDPYPSLNKLFVIVGRIQSMIVFAVLCGFIILGKEFICLWVGEEFVQSYYVALLLIMPISIPLCQTLGVDIQRALNKHNIRSLVYFIMSIINIISSIILIQKYGIIGAPLGTAISMIMGNCIAMNVIYIKYIGLDIIYFWKEIFKIVPSAILPTIILTMIQYFNQEYSWIGLILKIFTFIIIYVVCLYLFGMNNVEKSFINNVFNKILKKYKIIMKRDLK